MKDLHGKKLLILAGASVHVKVVEAAKDMGIYTIVTDYLPTSPAKEIADEAWMLNITDVDAIVQRCKEQGVDGVLSVCIDPAQRPYQQICEALDLPCYGTAEQVFKMTDKHAFKQLCSECGVDTIPEYTPEDAAQGRVEYPVFVKPVDSRGSRGQAVCFNDGELFAALETARSESSNGDVLIEKYMGGCQEVQMTYFFVNGTPYLIRSADSYTGSEENHLEKVVACAVSPSQYTDSYKKQAHHNAVAMFRKLGIKNGPVFMQGFEDNGRFRFFDPGLRLPGVDFERMYKAVYGIDIMKMLVHFALTGNCGVDGLPFDSETLGGHRAAVWFPTVKAGTIARIDGLDTIRNAPQTVSYLPRYTVGDTVDWEYNVNQRLSEVDVLAENTQQLKDTLQMFTQQLTARDCGATDMMFERFDADRII